jgi:hypothetical protein
MGVGRGAITLPCKKENCRDASKKFSWILWRSKPKLGCGSKERKKNKNMPQDVRLLGVGGGDYFDFQFGNISNIRCIINILVLS